MTENSKGSLAEALAALQGELKTIPKNKTGKISGTSKSSGKDFNFEYKYADLADVVEMAGPLMSKNGLSFSAKPTMTERGFVLAYTLRHTSGDDDSGEFPLPPLGVDIKQIGIAITYARRYTLTAMLGIVSDEDTDVQGAPEPAPAAKRAPAKKAAARPSPDAQQRHEDQQRKAYHAMRTQLGWTEDMGHGFIEDLSKNQFHGWSELDERGRGFVLDAMSREVDQMNQAGEQPGEVTGDRDE